MLPLRCSAQNYEWGRPCSSSEVAQLAKENGSTIDESKPFAELWMGTHPNCPAVVASTSTSLQDWIDDHPESLGPMVRRRFGTQLPFLFKVLSVNKALSIQSHPDKALAERLRRDYPKFYADDNHKPEMALALTDFEALCSFVEVGELKEVLANTPELRECVGEECAQAVQALQGPDKQVLKKAFTALMTRDPAEVTQAVSALCTRLRKEQEGGRELLPKEALVLRLDQQYPGGDVGVLSCFFLNLVTLSAGQAIYLAANEPHAYLAGELVECMATSDNVIRAGLTPKFKHTEVLCESLTYEQGRPEVLEGSRLAPGVRSYRPPFEEFEILAVDVPASSASEGSSAGRVVLPANEGPMLLLVQRGSGNASAKPGSVSSAGLKTEVELKRGSIIFVPAATAVTLTATEPLTIWGAACNANFFALHGALENALEATTAAAAASQLASSTPTSPAPVAIRPVAAVV